MLGLYLILVGIFGLATMFAIEIAKYVSHLIKERDYDRIEFFVAIVCVFIILVGVCTYVTWK